MSPKDKKLVLAGLAICIVIAIMSPFIASSNPDGLEKSAEDVGVPEVEPAYQAPFPDYTMEGLEKIGEIGALALGVLITLGLGYGVATIIKKRNPQKPE